LAIFFLVLLKGNIPSPGLGAGTLSFPDRRIGMRKNPRKKPETPLENRWKSNGFRAYNPSMSKKETWFRRPGPESLRQAIDWVAFAGTFASSLMSCTPAASS
jgi:hypothetical protein